MKKHVETLIELCEALSAPKATITSVAATGIASTATIGRWQRESRADPAGYSFEHDGVVAPLHIHMAAAARIGRQRFLDGERPPSKPLRHRAPIILDEVEADETADAPEAELSTEEASKIARTNAAPHRQPNAADAISAVRSRPAAPSPPVETPLQRDLQPSDKSLSEKPKPETALQRDLRERVEARARGETMPPIAPVHTAAPSPRYISPEERSEGIGAGIVRPGGFKTA